MSCLSTCHRVFLPFLTIVKKWGGLPLLLSVSPLWPRIASLPVTAVCVDAQADELLELSVHAVFSSATSPAVVRQALQEASALFVFTASRIGPLNRGFVASAGSSCTEISLTEAHDEI